MAHDLPNIGKPSWILALITLFGVAIASEDTLDLGARIQPPPLTARHAEPDFHVWCGAPIKGLDGRYHLFYSRWPVAAGFTAWVTRSEIAHAVADDPMGPYVFADVSLPARGADFWDGSATHAPSILLNNSRYCLFYLGNRGNGEFWNHRNQQRIGVAIADRPEGPWTRFDHPVIDVSPEPEAFDSLMVNCPAAFLRPDGRIQIIYKAVGKEPGKPNGGKVRHGVAMADRPEGPFQKQGRAFADLEAGGHWMVAEDIFAWYSRPAQRYYALTRDPAAKLTGAKNGVALLTSADGLAWTKAAHPQVLGSRFTWADGTASVYPVERPALLFEGDEPIVLFGATDGYQVKGRTSCNVRFPLKAAP